MTYLYALGLTEHSSVRRTSVAGDHPAPARQHGHGWRRHPARCGHSNVQGITDFALRPGACRGYLGAPTDGEQDLKTYVAKTPKMPCVRATDEPWPEPSRRWYVSLATRPGGERRDEGNGFA